MSVKRIRDFAPSSSRAEWYSIRNQADGSAEVSIYDEISPFGVTAQNFIKDLGKVKGALTLRINSGGGEVFDGLAIYNALKSRRQPVTVVIDGIAASIASVIAQAASPGQLLIAKRAQMMIHDGFTDAIGNAADFRKIADMLDEQSDNIAGVYADRTGKPVSYWREKMRDETWYHGEKAVDEGLADRVYEPAAANSLKNALKNSVNGNGMDDDDDDGDEDEDMENGGWVQRNGKWVFDPDNDGDDDYQASTDTDHGWWSADGKQLKPIPAAPDGSKPAKPMPKARSVRRFLDEKYSTADRKRLAKKGHALPDGSYPIADEEDLSNAIHAVGRGGADHDTIRRHIIKRARAMGKESMIPDNWNSDGSLKDAGSSNKLAGSRLLASVFTDALKGA